MMGLLHLYPCPHLTLTWGGRESTPSPSDFCSLDKYADIYDAIGLLALRGQ